MIFPREITNFAESALTKFASLEAATRFKSEFWGVIHSDLNASNVIVSENYPGFIDFAEAGPGLFAWDVLMLPFDLWWDYGNHAESAGSSLILAYKSAGAVEPTSELLRVCSEVRVVEAATWKRPSLGVPTSRCQQWIEQVLGVVQRLDTAPPAWMI